MRSFQANYVGIPIDCPHREKNGWTGDVYLACETGLFNFDVSDAYFEWLKILVDSQRPNGQLLGIAPNGSFMLYKWCGPAWDNVRLSLPFHIYLYTGKLEPIRYAFNAMERYLNYCRSVAQDHLIKFASATGLMPSREKKFLRQWFPLLITSIV